MIDTGMWFMLPVGVAIATVAMAAGIGGAVLFSPFFMLVLRLDPLLAIGAGLAIEVFGFSSGVIGYTLRRSIDFGIVKKLIYLTVPATVIGVALGRLLPPVALKLMLAGLLLYLAYGFLREGKECVPKDPRCTGVATARGGGAGLSAGIRAASMLGGLLVGMISAGLGEINEFNFLKKMGLPVPLASGTSVFLVAMSAIVGASSHAYLIISREGMDIFMEVFSVLVFAVPGVVVGAQLGVLIVKFVNARAMGKFVGLLFLVLGVLTASIAF